MTSLTSPPTFKEVNSIIRDVDAKAHSFFFSNQICQQYDFGMVDKFVIEAGWDNAKVFAHAEALTAPAQLGFFRLSVTNDGDILPFAFLYRSEVNKGYVDRVLGVIRNINTGDLSPCGIYSFDLNRGILNCLRERDPMITKFVSWAFPACMGLLLTKGVRKISTSPSAKQNAARAKAGKPLLPYITTVDLTAYRQATEPQGGTHASPRPHLRRAHVRRIANDNGDKLIPVAAALVNWDGSPLMRTEYQVRT